MAFAITGQSTREGVHEFTLSGKNYMYDANLDLLYTNSGGLAPSWGAPVTPEPFIRQQIINATNGQVGYGHTFINMPDPMRKPADLSDQTKVDLSPIVKLTLGRIPVMRNNKRVTGIGVIPRMQRVDFTKTIPIPKKRFLADMPTTPQELSDFINDYNSVDAAIAKGFNKMRRGRRW